MGLVGLGRNNSATHSAASSSATRPEAASATVSASSVSDNLKKVSPATNRRRSSQPRPQPNLLSPPRNESLPPPFSTIKPGVDRTPSVAASFAKAPQITTATPTNTNNNITTSCTTSSTLARPNTTTKPTRAAFTVASSSSSSSSSRKPLGPKDQNATPLPRLSSSLLKQKKEEGSMPYDSTADTNGSRSQMPSFSTTATARGVSRNPPTPKIASKAPRTPATGANRRTQRPFSTVSARETPTPRLTQHAQRAHCDEPSPCFTPHLSNNITPRSGSRQSRVDSANSTPSGTPNPERPEGWDPKSSFNVSTLSFEGEATRRPAAAFTSTPSDMNGHARQETQDSSNFKFFHASDAKTSSRPTSSSKSTSSKGPIFFYASGQTIENDQLPFPPILTPALGGQAQHDNPSSKFVYANGAPEVPPSPPPLISRGSGSIVSATSKVASNRSSANFPITSYPLSLGQRPISPTKLPLQPQLAAQKAVPPPGTASRTQIPSPQFGPASTGLRRSSIATSRSGGHSRSGSSVMGDFGLGASSKLLPSHISEPPLSSPAHVSSRPAPLTLASIIQAADKLNESEIQDSRDEAGSSLQSPTKSVVSTDLMSELVSNARRERKVQDLQITNASLEAINRTLERQLKKQTAELRRYRRLSRSGRLSLASTTIASRSPSETLLGGTTLGIGLSDLSEEDFDNEDEFDEDDSSSDTDSGTSSLSPSVIAQRDSKHRKRDEKRLQLDLSKHQQLIIDSQKINQSIKRCLDWTDELIKDGKKALEYRVRVSDIKLGGRVLYPLEEGIEHVPVTEYILDDTITVQPKASGDADTALDWPSEAQDRGSGVELPTDGGYSIRPS